MNTKTRLNCYIFSNLIISVLSLNFLLTDNSYTLNAISNSNSSLLTESSEMAPVGSSDILAINTLNETTKITVTKKSVQSKKVIDYVKPSYNSVTGANLVNYAKNYLGLPYVYGGNSLSTGTDCSGFTRLIYKEFGISLGRTVNSQLYSGKYVSKSDLQPGDLVFYGYSSNYATHVGIYMGSGLVIHQSNPSDGVKINSVNMMVYITARRLITADVTSQDKNPQEPEESEEVPSISTDDDLNNSNSDTSQDNNLSNDSEKVEIPDENLEQDNNNSTVTDENLDEEEPILPEDANKEEDKLDSTGQTDENTNTNNDIVNSNPPEENLDTNNNNLTSNEATSIVEEKKTDIIDK